MKTLQILEQLLNGNHLSDTELKEAEMIVNKQYNEIKSRKPQQIDFTRINNDVNGNPRYVCHFLNISDEYNDALKLAKTLGCRKFNNKQYGGGIVFSSYNITNLQTNI